jgi:GntR family transcriptional regulator/MocR family aminotransferase
VEDDYDSEFRYTASPIPSLQGLDTMGRVIYVGTFSKTMFPALRLGYLIVPHSLIEVFRAARSIADHLAPGLEQATLAEFIETGHFARHTRRMRAVYASRQRSLLAGVTRELAGILDATPTETGMHVVGWLTDRSIDDAAVARSALRAGVEVAPLSRYAIRATLPPGLLMGFAAVRPGELRTALLALRRAIRTARRPRLLTSR